MWDAGIWMPRANTDVIFSQLHICVQEHIPSLLCAQLSTGNNVVDLSLYLSCTEFHGVLTSHKPHLMHVLLFLYFTDKETEAQDVKNLRAC